MQDRITRAVSDAAGDAKELFLRALAIPSVSGDEARAIECFHDAFKSAGLTTELAPITEDIRDDPDYTKMVPDRKLEGRANLLAARQGSGGGRSVILQSHADVVEPDAGWDDAFVPKVDGDTIRARGACDAKGQLVTIYLALRALDALGAELSGDVSCHIVIEEESGGNGVLDMVRRGHVADAAVVLESTGGMVHPANRGAVWFQLHTSGKSVHMGRAHDGVNAIEKAHEAINCLRRYYNGLLERSVGYRLFERYEYPVQLCIGQIRGGSHPSAVAGECTVEGGIGFLPNMSIEQVKRELREAIEATDDDWLRSHFELRFDRLHNDAFEFPSDHPLPQTLSSAAGAVGLSGEICGWNVSCDARLYAKRGGMPTVVFGPGDLACAHSAEEQIEWTQIEQAARALVIFLLEWCK